ncbi:MBL fold metallo-hydrolase [Pikeienuella piscinae]|uniref:MBL fold metallo-hydrolase n=1 Tax=Pikeienuella piscinae TaxID=2748098 RepID=A0A7M3T6R6_9RHOB|nr:MBL fold metallo-hydrolase [Pikeienuella piscinae]
MSVNLCGGFGEKGRTSIAVDDGETCILLDAGIKVGAAGDDYHPRLPRPAERIFALFVTHAHEDHIGALPWLSERGFLGPVFMTEQTRAEMPATLAQYAQPTDLAGFRPEAMDIRLIEEGQSVNIGGLRVTSGASGHVAGGLWFHVTGGNSRLGYAGDVVPQSTVFPMRPIPECELLILDCSYGVDTVSGPERAEAIARWIDAHPGAAVLPTPLSGRSLELIAILDGRFAIASDMRGALLQQIARSGRPELSQRVARAEDWSPGQPLPDCALLVHDAMGQAGPSVAALEQAVADAAPVLLSGHLPEGSPGAILRAAGKADWLRMPTHPTLAENLAIWNRAGRPAALGHSCPPDALHALHSALPALDPTVQTGASVPLIERRCLESPDRQ